MQKKKTSFTLVSEVAMMLVAKSKKLGLSKTATVQLAIRKLEA